MAEQSLNNDRRSNFGFKSVKELRLFTLHLIGKYCLEMIFKIDSLQVM
jgi:hypothetical protein